MHIDEQNCPHDGESPTGKNQHWQFLMKESSGKVKRSMCSEPTARPSFSSLKSSEHSASASSLALGWPSSPGSAPTSAIADPVYASSIKASNACHETHDSSYKCWLWKNEQVHFSTLFVSTKITKLLHLNKWCTKKSKQQPSYSNLRK